MGNDYSSYAHSTICALLTHFSDETAARNIMATSPLQTMSPAGPDSHATLLTAKPTRSYHSAYCDTDHSLVCCNIRIQPRRLHRAKPPRRPRVDISKAKDPRKVEMIVKSLEDSLQTKPPEGDAKQIWDHLRDVIHGTALSVFGRKQECSQD